MRKLRQWAIRLTLLSVFATAGWGWWRLSVMNWAINQQGTFVLSPILSTDAKPILESAAPLPKCPRPLVAKPVIATDGARSVVIAQALDTRTSELVQWGPVENQQWQPPVMIANFPANTQFVGDPWIEGDRRGNYYLVHTSHLHGSLIFRRSNDYANTWTSPRELATGTDRPVLGISPNGKLLVVAANLAKLAPHASKVPLNSSDPKFREKLAERIVYSTLILQSADFGRTWTRLPEPFGSNHAIPFSVAIDDHGRIGATWITRPVQPSASSKITSSSVMIWTTDAGKHWSELQLVSDLQSDRQHPFNGERFPVLALGDRGRVHVAYVDELGHKLFMRHGDWRTWSKPVLLSSESADEIRMPAIAALSQMVHISWMERRGDRWQIYYQGSRDGGESLSGRLLLSVPHASSKLIKKEGFLISSDDDQTCLHVDANGTIHAVWAVKNMALNPPGEVWHAMVRWTAGE